MSRPLAIVGSPRRAMLSLADYRTERPVTELRQLLDIRIRTVHTGIVRLRTYAVGSESRHSDATTMASTVLAFPSRFARDVGAWVASVGHDSAGLKIRNRATEYTT